MVLHLKPDSTGVEVTGFATASIVSRATWMDELTSVQGFPISPEAAGRILLATSRELTRLDSITKAPVIHHFSESVSGVTTIRSAWKIKGCLPSASWPTRGNIDIRDLKKIGIVGRTGSGKSTLIQALFRVVEPTEGKIVIDGIDISMLGLHDLRSRFGIIPQEPVLFEGTVRSNIDPTGVYSDDEIWKSLDRCQLKEVVAGKPEKLDSMVVDSGDNWSVGQRQLLCLGRVMLKHSRILFMDEATASVDSQTDAVIQRIIREDFASCTIISIAHRIPTVMDCDRVLVVDAGFAAEFDKPSNLIERPSLFGALVQEYANRSSDL
ncbi:unnamed protein product [Spirodela intermedia]|uniref:ABC transporter domain-containing protein n=1 Tax=Spirodela intermedia TaxID=51605 RepID=A0A7I8I9B6_SPIIN|nr:unnamed protein product [Spirodela intermedia]CAA6654286.1 unnamed protein product [Spirodela intermedia]